MIRIKRGNVARKRRKKILFFTSGYRGTSSKLFRIANQKMMKAFKYSYINKKQKKRIFRQIWINRINAVARLNASSYNRIISSLKKANIILNRKMLSQIFLLDPLLIKIFYTFISIYIIW